MDHPEFRDAGPGPIALAAVFAAQSQFSRSDPSFGGGALTCAHYWITASSDIAIGRIFFTYTDSGGRQFNYSEFAGNSAAVAVSMAHYPESRNASNAAGQFGTQVALGMAVNIVKEFWPGREREASGRRD